MSSMTQADRLLHYVRKHGMVRTRDLEEIDVPRQVLKRLTDRGQLTQQARGIYTVPDYEPTLHTSLALVAARAPKVVICLISALSFHDLTTQLPHAVWIMIDKSGHRPRIDTPAVRVIRASGKTLTDGIEMHQIEGVTVAITNPAKTVADCFKYRNHVGMDVAVEALRDCLRKRKATPSEIYEMAKINRVAKTIRPYMEALV